MGVNTRQSDDDIITDINVTPFVDIALVLLIIFMVTATYIVAQSIPVDLPKAGTGEDTVTTFAIALTQDNQLYLDGQKMDETQIKLNIRKAREKNEEIRVVIAADKAVQHGKVVRVIDLIRKEGVSKFAINIEAEDGVL